MKLFFECQKCKEMVEMPNPIVVWLDNGATLFCPVCGIGNTITFSTESKESIDRREQATKAQALKGGE